MPRDTLSSLRNIFRTINIPIFKLLMKTGGDSPDSHFSIFLPLEQQYKVV